MILVTGGTGFLGSYIIKELINKGHSVRAIRRSNKIPFYISREILDKVSWVEGDVLDVVSLDDAMQDVDTVIHSAAVVSFNSHNRNEMYQVNVEGTANVMNVALENNIRRVVHISSIAALGRTSSGDHVNEEKTWVESSLNTHYSISKKKAEMEVWRGMGEGLEAVIANPSTILGFGNWHEGSCSIFKRIYQQFSWYTNGVNGFVDVEDVAKAVVLLMESNITEQRFIINSENWEFKQLFNTIARGFNKKPPSREAGPFLSGMAWRLERAKSIFSEYKPLLTRETSKIALSKTFFYSDKLLGALPGFSFTPLEESITKACKKYEEALKAMQLKP
jgi:dihydroflavonol-4-reductase